MRGTEEGTHTLGLSHPYTHTDTLTDNLQQLAFCAHTHTHMHTDSHTPTNTRQQSLNLAVAAQVQRFLSCTDNIEDHLPGSCQDSVSQHASVERLQASGGLRSAGGLNPKDYPGAEPQVEERAATPMPLPASRSSSVGLAPAGVADAGSWSLELPERGAGGAPGGAPQPLQRTGFTQRLSHASFGKTPPFQTRPLTVNCSIQKHYIAFRNNSSEKVSFFFFFSQGWTKPIHKIPQN